VELKKLSSGDFLSNALVYNRTDNDTYGYLHFYKKDKISKDEDLIEYVLLDKNFNKIASGEFKDDIVKTMWKSFFYKSFYASYLDDIIVIEILEQTKQYNIKSKYRLLDVKNNTLSESFTLDSDLKKNYASTRNLEKTIVSNYNRTLWGYLFHTPLYNNEELQRFSTKPSSKREKLNLDQKKIHLLDKNLNPIWSYDYNPKATKNNYEKLYYIPFENNLEKDILILQKSLFGKDNEKKEKNKEYNNSFLFFKGLNGNLIREIKPFGIFEHNGMTIKETFNQKIFSENNNQVAFLNNIMDGKT
jgi:hypothetical protein